MNSPRKFRMLDWLFITIVLLAAVTYFSPVQIPVLVFKAAQVTLSGWIGYWFDRGIAPTARPDNPTLGATEMAAASLRRAIIIGAAMIAGALGA